MFSSHDSNSPDGYLKPVFPIKDKLRRFCWNLAWILLCRWTPKPLHNWRIFVLRLFGAKIGPQNSIYPTCIIWAPWLLQTEEVVSIGPDAEVYNPGGALLRHHTVVSQGAYLCGATHNYNSQDFTYIKRKIKLEPYVWICAKAIVLPGVQCGAGSVLGAGAVAARNLAPWTVYTGNPAQEGRLRHNFTLQQAVATADVAPI